MKKRLEVSWNIETLKHLCYSASSRKVCRENMRNLFPGFYEHTEEELNKLWQDGIFIFDTNMLLNVYRYSSETRNRYFEILRQLMEQLWIPYQVAYEYQDNRLTVIQEQIEAYKKIANVLHTTSQNLDSSLEPYKRKHGFINVAEPT
jgi:hypothetical protein